MIIGYGRDSNLKLSFSKTTTGDRFHGRPTTSRRGGMVMVERPKPQLFIQVKVGDVWNRIDIADVQKPYNLEKLDIALNALFPLWTECRISPFHGARYIYDGHEEATDGSFTRPTVTETIGADKHLEIADFLDGFAEHLTTISERHEYDSDIAAFRRHASLLRSGAIQDTSAGVEV